MHVSGVYACALKPQIFFACGTSLSKSHTGITGYHSSNHANFSSPSAAAPTSSCGSWCCTVSDKLVKSLLVFGELVLLDDKKCEVGRKMLRGL